MTHQTNDTMEIIKFSAQARYERKLYSLNSNPVYLSELGKNLEAGHIRKQKYGYYVNKDIPTKNMLKALRTLPWQNTAQEWARLHVTEALMNLKT